MPTTVAELVAKLSVDTRDFTRGVNDATKRMDQLESASTRTSDSSSRLAGSMRKAAVALGGLYAAKQVGGFLLDAGNAASNFNESVNAVTVATGAASQEILAMGNTAAKQFGLSTTAFNQAAVAFSAFNEQIGGGAKTFETFTGRATDFASVMNLEVNDAMQIFQSGLAGETEPLRRFGINLSAAAVNAYAYREGLAAAGEELSDQEKVQARYGSLLEQTAKFQGDFANTSGELANSQRILGAEYENAKVQLGENLVPFMLQATKVGLTLVDTFNNIGKAIQIYDVKSRNLVHTLSLGLIGGAGAADETLAKFNSTVLYAQSQMEEGRAQTQVFGEWLKHLADGGVITTKVVDSMGEALGSTNEEMKKNIEVAVRNAEVLGLNAFQVKVLSDAFNALPAVVGATDGELYTLEESARGAGAGLDAAADGTDNLQASLNRFSVPGVWERFVDSVNNVRAAMNSSGGGGGANLHFASGGVVPGPMGAPRLAVVHGGEEVLTASQRIERNVTVNMNGNVSSSGMLTDELTMGLLMGGVNEHVEFRGLSDLRGG